MFLLEAEILEAVLRVHVAAGHDCTLVRDEFDGVRYDERWGNRDSGDFVSMCPSPLSQKSTSLGSSASSFMDLMDPRDVERQDDRRLQALPPALPPLSRVGRRSLLVLSAEAARGCVPCAMMVEVVTRFGRCGEAAGGGKDATEGFHVFAGMRSAPFEGMVSEVDGVTSDAMMTGNGGLGWYDGEEHDDDAPDDSDGVFVLVLESSEALGN